MSELPDLDDAMFKLATGEEFVLPADTPPAAASASPNGGAPQQGVPPVYAGRSSSGRSADVAR